MMKELEQVVLAKNFRTDRLHKGDVGRIVHAYKGGEMYEVEFMRGDGTTIAVVSLKPSHIRRLADRDVLCVRPFSPILQPV